MTKKGNAPGSSSPGFGRGGPRLVLWGGGAAGAAKSKRRCRPLPLREKLYQRVLELREAGLSYSQIAQRIYEEFGERLDRRQVSAWCTGEYKPTRKIRYELKLGSDLGWILGAAIGDDNIRF